MAELDILERRLYVLLHTSSSLHRNMAEVLRLLTRLAELPKTIAWRFLLVRQAAGVAEDFVGHVPLLFYGNTALLECDTTERRFRLHKVWCGYRLSWRAPHHTRWHSRWVPPGHGYLLYQAAWNQAARELNSLNLDRPSVQRKMTELYDPHGLAFALKVSRYTVSVQTQTRLVDTIFNMMQVMEDSKRPLLPARA